MATKPDNDTEANNANKNMHDTSKEDRPAQYRFARVYSQHENALSDNYYAQSARTSFWLELCIFSQHSSFQDC